MDSQTLFKQGVAAIRDQNDMDSGRRLLSQALRLDPQNDKAWLWLSRTVNDPQKQLQCVERALKINPANQTAMQMKDRYTAALIAQDPLVGEAAIQQRVTRKQKVYSPQEIARMELLMSKAERLQKSGDIDKAIDQWEEVLKIQPDHETAIANAVRYLVKGGFHDDAKDLIVRAIESGTEFPAIYLTAIDFAKRDQDHRRIDGLVEQFVALPTVSAEMIAKQVDYYRASGNFDEGLHVLDIALERHPNDAELLLRAGKIYDEMGRMREAARFYNQAAHAGGKAAKEADKLMADYSPVITDRERGSIALAWREAVGFALVLFMMGFLDAGLNFAGMGSRWLGILIGLAGGYLLITATSSPQQRGLAGLLGGTIPEKLKHGDEADFHARGRAHEDPSDLPMLPVAVRVVFGVLGIALLVGAFAMVFSTALNLLGNPVAPYIPLF